MLSFSSPSYINIVLVQKHIQFQSKHPKDQIFLLISRTRKMLSSILNLFFFLFLFLFSTIPFTISQPSPPTPQAQPPAASSCNDIFLSYIYEGGTQIKPTNRTHQPYRFQSTLTIQNNGPDELKSWEVFVGFQNEELLVSASNAVLADGTTFPAAVGNGTVFAGYPMTDLKTAIETAGDDTQTTVQVELLGTQFNVPLKDVPWPSKISLANDGFVCPDATKEGNVMYVCCTRDPKFESNITVDEEFLPRQSGDLPIMYDVIKTYDSSYWAQVTIANHNPLGRLDNWKLSWDWMHDEFIYSMKGAYPDVVDSTDCIYGPQGTYYKDLDFANVLNCKRRPTIIDLPPTLANDTTLGMIPSCCRNGTILPTTMDPSKSTSAFQLQVFKMPPALNRSALTPPQNWKINGTLNPDYQCGPPVRVSPSQFQTGLPSNNTAFASWQVVCNITHPKGVRPRCCVSFSAYYNDSVIPCSTCACGCPSNTARTCSATAPAILLPPQALLVPFENRTAMAVAWADLKHRAVPNPLPCSDNCGVSINWHLYTDYSRGWSARVTVFNWQDTAFPDWFAAVQLDKATAGFEAMYSFNGSTVVVDGANNTLFMQGLPGLDYLVGETDGANPNKDPRVPGKQQTVISFTKKTTPGINVAAGDGFPTKVFFNGEECSLPSIYPTSNGNEKGSGVILSILLAAVVFMLIQQ